MGLLVLTALVCWGCGASGLQADPFSPRSGSSGAAEQVSPDLFGSLRGKLSPEGELPRFRAGADGPPRARLLANQEVIADDPSGQIVVKTDDQGNFFFPRLTAGERTIRIGNTGASINVTVIAQAEVMLQEFPVDRDQAVSKVKDTLAQDSGFTLDEAFIIAPLNPLPRGVRLSQALLTDESGDPEVTVLTSEQWLVYADPTPMVSFHHQLSHFLVDARTGTVRRLSRTAPPLLNGISYYQQSEDYLTSPALVESPLVQAEQSGSLPVKVNARHTHPRAEAHLKGTGRTYVLIVDGHNHGSSRADVRKFREVILPGLPLPPVALIQEIVTPPLLTDPAAQVLAQFQTLCKLTQPEDTLFLYFTSHGSKDGLLLGGKKFRKDQPSDSRDVRLEWSRFDFKDCRACQVVVITEACHSGGMFERGSLRSPLFTGLDVVGRKWALLSSAQRSGPNEGNSVAIPPYILEIETGGLFTTYFAPAVASIQGTNLFDELEVAHAAAKGELQGFSSFFRAETQKRARAMNPQILVDRAEGEVCADAVAEPPPPTPGDSPTPNDSPTPAPDGCAGVVYRNLSDRAVQVRFTTTNGVQINNGQFVTIGPQTEFSQATPPLENLDLIFFNQSGDFPQGFQFSVGCGFQIVFVDTPFSLSFFEEPLP